MTSGKVQIATTFGHNTVRGVLVNRYFAVHRDKFVSERRYRVTHRLTGFSCGGNLTSKDKAVALARTLTARFGKLWDFSDPLTVKGNPAFSKVKPLLEKAGAV